MTMTADSRAALPEARRFVDDDEAATMVAGMLKALAHPQRLRIIDLLCAGEHHVTAIVDGLRLPQAIVSQQLRILRMQRLVRTRRDGGFVWYQIAEPRLLELLQCLSGCPSTRR